MSDERYCPTNFSLSFAGKESCLGDRRQTEGLSDRQRKTASRTLEELMVVCRRFLSLAFLLVFCPLVSAQQQPPIEPGPFRQPDLVELVRLDPTIKRDIRYAT